MPSATIVNGVEWAVGWRFKTNTLAPKPLVGYSVLIQIRLAKGASSILASYTEESPYVTFIPESGVVDLNLPPSVTGAFRFKSGVIDCLVYNDIDTDGDRSPTLDLFVDQGVSRL